MRTKLIAAPMLGLAVLVAACSGSAATTAPTAAPTAAPTEAPSAAPSEAASPAASSAASPAASAAASPAAGAGGVALADSKYGKILTDSQGRTLYLFTADSANKTTCTGDCLANWPAFTSDGAPKLGTGLDAGDFGSLTRADNGAKQVTFYGLPLYYFAGDKAAGDTNGQGLFGKWYVVSSEGKPIQSAATGSTY